LDAVQNKLNEDPDCTDSEFIQYSQNWVEQLHDANSCYNSTPKALTRKTPLEVHYPGVHQETTSRLLVDDEDCYVFAETQRIQPQPNLSPDEILEEVSEKQARNARTYLEKAQKKRVVRQRDVLSAKQVVLVRFLTSRKRKKNEIGKSYFPYSGTIEEVLRHGARYLIRWGVAPGNNEKSGQVSKVKFLRSQLLPVSEEFEGLTVQHYQNADSWNSYEVKSVDLKIKEVLRERSTADGFLETLCLLHQKRTPVWKPITSVAESDAYMYYEKHKVICPTY
jgi:hypothetical protein